MFVSSIVVKVVDVKVMDATFNILSTMILSSIAVKVVYVNVFVASFFILSAMIVSPMRCIDVLSLIVISK